MNTILYMDGHLGNDKWPTENITGSPVDVILKLYQLIDDVPDLGSIEMPVEDLIKLLMGKSV